MGVSAGTCLGYMQAPSDSPPDVSPQLLHICNVVDVCEGLSLKAVIATAERQPKPSGSPGEQQLPGGLCLVSVDVDCVMHCMACQA